MRWVTKSQQERLLSCLDPLRTGLAGRLPWWMDKLQLTWICFVREAKAFEEAFAILRLHFPDAK